jgi:hypothetical protein
MTDKSDNSHSTELPAESGDGPSAESGDGPPAKSGDGPPAESGKRLWKTSRGGKPAQVSGPSEEAVDKTRAWTGLWVVAGGDVAIAAAAGIALFKFSSANSGVLASILSSAFAAISTMTTAYFGIRESSNTAQRSIKHRTPSDS